jgi:hypothetical protein
MKVELKTREGVVWVVEDYTHESHYIHTCIRCNKQYNETNNIGRYNCRYHSGKTDHDGKWTCCNKNVSLVHNNGCKKCDHTPYVYSSDRVLRSVPMSLFENDFAPPLPEAIAETRLIKNTNDFITDHVVENMFLLVKTFAD